MRFHGSVERDATNEAALHSLIDAAYADIEARVERGSRAGGDRPHVTGIPLPPLAPGGGRPDLVPAHPSIRRPFTAESRMLLLRLRWTGPSSPMEEHSNS